MKSPLKNIISSIGGVANAIQGGNRPPGSARPGGIDASLEAIESWRNFMADKYGLDLVKADAMREKKRGSNDNKAKLPADWKSRLLPGENPIIGRARLLKAQKSSAFGGYTPLPGETATITRNTGFLGQTTGGGAAGVSNQSGDTPYNTGANYIEHQGLSAGLASNRTMERRAGMGNRNVRRNTYGVGGGSYQVGEYQDEWSANDEGRDRHNLRSTYDKFYEDPFSTKPEANMDPRTLGAMEGMYGDLASRQNSVMGNVPGAFRGSGQQFNDDRQDQFNDVLFNPNAKSDRGMNEMYNNFYNTQGIV